MRGTLAAFALVSGTLASLARRSRLSFAFASSFALAFGDPPNVTIKENAQRAILAVSQHGSGDLCQDILGWSLSDTSVYKTWRTYAMWAKRLVVSSIFT